MRIDNLSPILARNLLAALPKAAPGFALDGEEPAAHATNAPQTTGATAPTPSVAMLVTLAASQQAVERRRRMAKDAERGIDALDRLHKELLAGAPSVERLREIAEWSQSFETPEDPVLASLLSDIDLRVRVELAKFDIEA